MTLVPGGGTGIEQELAHLWTAALDAACDEWWLDLAFDTPTERGNLASSDPSPFSGASMIKTFVLATVHDAVAHGARRWDETLTLRHTHRAADDGIMAGWRDGAPVSLHAACSLMVALSDNTATNLVVDHLGGTAALNRALAGAGYRSRLRSWVGGAGRDEAAPVPEGWARRSRPGLSIVHPDEHAHVVESLRNAADPTAFALLTRQLDRRALARHVRDDVTFAHKTGTVHGLRHDAGVLLADEGWVRIGCFTDGPDRDEGTDDRAAVAMGEAFAETLRLLGLGDLVIA